MQRESMNYDALIVGAGPAGLAAAIRLRQLARARDADLSVCVLEKGSEVGAHILSGAVLAPRALDELLPDWRERDAPLRTAVAADEFYFLSSSASAFKVPGFLVPPPMRNRGAYIVSLGAVCRWLGAQAEALGADIYPGFAAAEILYDDAGAVTGVATGDMGVAASGARKDGFAPGMALHAKHTIFAEGSRGHLGRQLIARFALDQGRDPQHYGIGLKELWEVEPRRRRPGLVVHGAGWPLSKSAGGFFLYHLEERQAAVGLIVDLNYRNPWLSPFDEFQRLKHHPLIADALRGGKRVAYGARAISKGGLNSLPKMSMPGALLVGCDAGTLNFARVKGVHTAMKSGMIAAETVFDHLRENGAAGADLTDFDRAFRASWAGRELRRARNFGPALHKFGVHGGAAFNYLDQTLFRGYLPLTLHDAVPDHATLQPAAECEKIAYPKPDGVLSFDKLSSVFVSNTNHEEDQPCHLTLKDDAVPVAVNLARYGGPEQRYCPAGVYEFARDKVSDNGGSRLRINAQNCVHCKTCDIKDPEQNIVWVAPEGGGGPNYPNM